MTRTDIINGYIEGRGYENYLEIGIEEGINWGQVNAKRKYGVDPDIRWKRKFPEIYHGKSDQFFDNVRGVLFDIVFVDGLHEFRQVIRDVNNSLRLLSNGGVIILHDILPANEGQQLMPRQQADWTGDVWKAWLYFRATRKNLHMVVYDCDSGVGIIERGWQSCPKLPDGWDVMWWDWGWQDFLEHRGKFNILGV